MNQTEATELVAGWLDWSGRILIVTPTEGDHPPVILCTALDGTRLSVTVEILAQP